MDANQGHSNKRQRPNDGHWVPSSNQQAAPVHSYPSPEMIAYYQANPEVFRLLQASVVGDQLAQPPQQPPATPPRNSMAVDVPPTPIRENQRPTLLQGPFHHDQIASLDSRINRCTKDYSELLKAGADIHMRLGEIVSAEREKNSRLVAIQEEILTLETNLAKAKQEASMKKEEILALKEEEKRLHEEYKTVDIEKVVAERETYTDIRHLFQKTEGKGSTAYSNLDLSEMATMVSYWGRLKLHNEPLKRASQLTVVTRDELATILRTISDFGYLNNPDVVKALGGMSIGTQNRDKKTTMKIYAKILGLVDDLPSDEEEEEKEE